MGNGKSKNRGYGSTSMQGAPSFKPQNPSLSASQSTLTTQGYADAFRRKYGYIADNFSSLEQVQAALRESGLESSNLILGIDFTKSNEWTGKASFGRRCLHSVGPHEQNPYEQAVAIIGKTLSGFDEDNLIPCYGFGDVSTHDTHVFSFNSDDRSCCGFEEALTRYREVSPNVKLSGPTSFAPIIETAVRIVEQSGGQYHVLVIVADGQVTRSADVPPGMYSEQERATVEAIVAASNYPLSIVMVGVGDGPWELMNEFDDRLPQRNFDNFQFVNLSKIMMKAVPPSAKEVLFSLAALMEIPQQYKACTELGLIGHRTGRMPPRKPLPPPMTVLQADSAMESKPGAAPSFPAAAGGGSSCPVCFSETLNMAFNCGHRTCRDCGTQLTSCPICRAPISSRINLF